MKTDIVLVGFFKELTKQIGKKLALDFNLYYVDVEEMIEYQLINEAEIENLCGIDYLNSLKQKILKDISHYENTLITIPYNIFSEHNNVDMFRENCTIVFLNFTKEWLEEKTKQEKDEKIKKSGEVFLLAYEERTKFCESNSDIVIDMSKPELENSYRIVKKSLNKYYL